MRPYEGPGGISDAITETVSYDGYTVKVVTEGDPPPELREALDVLSGYAMTTDVEPPGAECDAADCG
jgi:hypothetical protein